MRKKTFTRAEQKIRVISRFAFLIARDKKEIWQTSYQLAKGLGLSPSSYFRSILNEMVKDGELVARHRSKAGRWSGLQYALPPGTYAMPRIRELKINGLDVPEEQLRLLM